MAILETEKTTPIVMLHGLLGGPENWKSMIPHLPRSCNPIAPSIPFFDKELGLNSINAVVEYVGNYLRGITADGFVLMGNSLGGHIAALLAVEVPERVRGLILTGSSGLFERGFSKVPGAHPGIEWIYTKCCEVFYDSCHVTDVLVKNVMDIICDRQKARILIQLAKSAKQDNIADKLEEISCPTLLIWGKQDKVTEREVAEEFHRKIHQSKLIWLNNCGHAPMIEHPVDFGREVVQWWASCDCHHLGNQ